MLQEYWASTVIFIGIFSQCGYLSIIYTGAPIVGLLGAVSQESNKVV